MRDAHCWVATRALVKLDELLKHDTRSRFRHPAMGTTDLNHPAGERTFEMKAVVHRGPYDVSVEEVPDARIEGPLDALVRITTTNICGSDLHMGKDRG